LAQLRRRLPDVPTSGCSPGNSSGGSIRRTHALLMQQHHLLVLLKLRWFKTSH
jgi:hypothetical protein